MESVAGLPWTEWPNVRGISGRMTVEYAVEGIEVVLHSLEIVSVATDQLGEKIATLAQDGDRITGAMDELLTRAWA